MYFKKNMLPVIPASEYDDIATEFLETYFEDALMKPMSVPIYEIASNEMKLTINECCLSEESDIYGMTVFSDGYIEVYNPKEELADTLFFKEKTILIDPLAIQKTNLGCRNNTIAHECFHWYKHRYYYKLQQLSLPRIAKYCSCSINAAPTITEEEQIMEIQAVAMAPRILMPKMMFIQVAMNFDLLKEKEYAVNELSKFFQVSKQSALIRLRECRMI
jgi:Zn-dependent peptidase ImmA (M78 family)